MTAPTYTWVLLVLSYYKLGLRLGVCVVVLYKGILISASG